MNFNISEEQQELVDLAEKFTREEVIPNAAHYDQVCVKTAKTFHQYCPAPNSL